MMAYYSDKMSDLARLFGTADLEVDDRRLRVGQVAYEIIDDVIVVLPPERRPSGAHRRSDGSSSFAPDIQSTFGREWSTFDRLLPEHQDEFRAYFDLVDLAGLEGSLVCDLGCGMGRHSMLLAPRCRRMVLVDFSEAIFVARRNLAPLADAIFVMGDVSDLPFADDCCDFAFSLGVLHHLPLDALDAVRSLGRLTPRLLVYLYYALDNRPAYFRAILRLVSAVRRRTAGIESERARLAITAAITYAVYVPLARLGSARERRGWRLALPLADYAGNSAERMRQDVYDRFFTSIEQRFSRHDISALTDRFSRVDVSDTPPFWHFLCTR